MRVTANRCIPFACLLVASCAATGDTRSGGRAEPSTPEFALGPVAWIAGIEGDVVAGGGEGSEANLEHPLSFDSGIMGAVELRTGPWSVYADGLYVDYRGSTRDLEGLTTEVSIDATVVALAVGRQIGRWRLGERGAFELAGYAGARLASVALDVETQAVGGGEASRTWVDPIVGLRASAGWDEVLALSLAGDVGGFGVASDLVWQATGALHWWPWRAFGLAAGYRVLDYDFDDEDPGDTLRFDVQLRGPFVALLGRF